MNVLSMVNKGLALFQWKQDAEGAERCCNEALRTDPECEAAVATLAQLSLQQGKIDVAVTMFERHTELARNEPELVNALTYQYVRKSVSYHGAWTDNDSHCRHRMLSSSLSRTTLTWQDNFDRWRVPWRRDGRKGYHHIVDFYVTPCWVPWAAARCEGREHGG
jgi:hypothetical protein